MSPRKRLRFVVEMYFLLPCALTTPGDTVRSTVCLLLRLVSLNGTIRLLSRLDVSPASAVRSRFLPAFAQSLVKASLSFASILCQLIIARQEDGNHLKISSLMNRLSVSKVELLSFMFVFPEGKDTTPKPDGLGDWLTPS